MISFLVGTVEVFQNGCDGAGGSGCSQATNNGLATTAGTVVNTLLTIIGAIAVLMVVIGGLQMVLSSGDPKRVERARNTILYAIIGLVVASLAYAIVNFVTGKF